MAVAPPLSVADPGDAKGRSPYAAAFCRYATPDV